MHYHCAAIVSPALFMHGIVQILNKLTCECATLCFIVTSIQMVL